MTTTTMDRDRSFQTQVTARAEERKALKKMFPWRLFLRFVSAQLLLMLAILGIAGMSFRGLFTDWVVKQNGAQVRDSLISLSRDLGTGDLSRWCEEHTAGRSSFALYRASGGGEAICNTIPVARPETDLAQARGGGFGTATAYDRENQTYIMLVSIPVPAEGGRPALILRSGRPLTKLKEALVFLDRSMAGTLLLLSGILAGFSLWMGRRLMFPLGRLIIKAKRVLPDSSRPGHAESDLDLEEDLSRNDPGEWTELEDTLDLIRTDLRAKTETLSREREELATLMSALGDAILAVDSDGNLLFFNSRFALLFGDRELQTRRPRLAELFRSPEVLGVFNAALKEGRHEVASAKLHSNPDASPHYFAISVAPLRKASGKVYGAIGIFHDVTELKRAEQIRIDFVANVSHELRTPLTSIKGYTDTLVEDAKKGRTEDTLSFLQIIARNVDRLMSLIGDLLDLSSLESGAEVVKTPVNTRELTERVLSQLESFRAEKRHRIETVYDAAAVQADSGRLEQVLVNLVGNAIKYVPPGGKIRIHWEKKPDQSVLLRVADSGPGIPPEHQPRLFERFYRIDKARSREMGGTGLGLAIVKHIVQSHGGSVYVMSEVGKGAEFVCRFPG